jgi:hypothetical protein
MPTHRSMPTRQQEAFEDSRVRASPRICRLTCASDKEHTFTERDDSPTMAAQIMGSVGVRQAEIRSPEIKSSFGKRRRTNADKYTLVIQNLSIGARLTRGDYPSDSHGGNDHYKQTFCRLCHVRAWQLDAYGEEASCENDACDFKRQGI